MGLNIGEYQMYVWVVNIIATMAATIDAINMLFRLVEPRIRERIIKAPAMYPANMPLTIRPSQSAVGTNHSPKYAAEPNV